MKNIDKKTVESFGDEWGRFDQGGLTSAEANKIFDNYFFCDCSCFLGCWIVGTIFSILSH